MLLRKKSGTWIRWKPSWCWISTSTARFDPTTFRLGNQKTVPSVEMFWRRTYDVFLVVKSWTRLSLTICPLKNVKIVVSNGNWSIFQWHKFETHPKRKQPTPRTDIIEKDYIIVNNNLCFLMCFFLCCACRDEFGSCATLALDVGHLRLAKNLAGIVEWSGRNCASWHSFSDVDSQVEGFPFFTVYICTYTDTIHIPHLWQQQVLEHVPGSCKSSKKTSGAISCQELEQAPIAYSEFCWRWTLLEGVKHLMQQRYCQTSRPAD